MATAKIDMAAIDALIADICAMDKDTTGLVARITEALT